MSEKQFKTYDELLQLLVARGVDASTAQLRNYAKKCFQNEGYYNLINGYKQLFIKPKESHDEEDTYREGTTVNEIYALYDFDRKIRNLFLKNILTIETTVKSLIAYYFSEKYGHENYLLYANFNTEKRDASKNITALFADIQRQISSRYSDPSILHYLKNYGYLPLWVLNNILTLGTVSKFYSLMKQPERQEIAKKFSLNDAELESALFYLSKIRNFCAHGNRLYCFRSKTPIFTSVMHDTLGLQKNDKGEYLSGKRDLFAAVIILKCLLPKTIFKTFVKSIYHELDILQRKLKVLTEEDVLVVMGFPKDWRGHILS